MKLADRERYLIAVAIPTILALGYWSGLRPAYELRAASASAAVAAASSAQAGDLEQEQKRLQAESLALDGRAAACLERENRLLELWPRAERRSASAARLGELVRAGGSRVEAARIADSSEVVLGKDQRRLERYVLGLGARRPVLWRLDFRADYASLTSALENLASSESSLIPLALRAEPDRGFEQLACTLWAWL